MKKSHISLTSLAVVLALLFAGCGKSDEDKARDTAKALQEEAAASKKKDSSSSKDNNDSSDSSSKDNEDRNDSSSNDDEDYSDAEDTADALAALTGNPECFSIAAAMTPLMLSIELGVTNSDEVEGLTNELSDVADSLGDNIPDELADELDTLTAAVERTNGDPEAFADDEEGQAAYDNIQTYLDENCA